MNEIPLIILVIVSAFTMNLTLQYALGIKGAAESRSKGNISSYIILCIIFLTVILLWILFTKILYMVISGIFIYILIIPIGYIVYEGLEYSFFRFVVKKEPDEGSFISFPGGIASTALFICVNIANSFMQAVVLSFGFTGGILVVSLVIKEIRKRAALENIPRFIRGKPLVLVAMGMMSLIFTVGSLMILRMINLK